MNLTAHPLSVAAELAWKGDLLRGADLATKHRVPRRRRRWPAWPARPGESVRTLADSLARAVCPVIPRDVPER